MSARQSRAVTLALAWLLRDPFERTPLKAAARYRIAKSSIYRAMRRAGVPVANRGPVKQTVVTQLQDQYRERDFVEIRPVQGQPEAWLGS